MTSSIRQPRVSVLVLGRTPTESLQGTLSSLSRQRGVSPEEFEVIPADEGMTLPELLSLAHAPLVGLLLGHPVVTARLIEHVLRAARLRDDPLIAVPGYVVDGLRERAVTDMPESLFEGARFSASNPRGYLTNLRSSDAFFFKRSTVVALANVEAETPRTAFGALLGLEDVGLVVLGGEACFRDGAQSQTTPDRLPRRGKEPLLYGAIPGPARGFLRDSIGESAVRDSVLEEAGKPPWPRDRALPTRPTLDSPELSVVIVGFNIPRQLENTLYSLSAGFQRNVNPASYEVLLVENESPSMLGPTGATAFGSNFRYFSRREAGVSPAPALNFGVAQARAPAVAIMVDGARMISPRVIEHTLVALRSHERPLVVVPGFHLGPAPQHVSSVDGYDEETEQALLASVNWRERGYRLFEISAFDEATENGFLSPLLEATFLACPRECLDAIRGADERFVSTGGGLVNLDLFDRLCRLSDTRCVMLWGEGNFHQYHGGVSSRGGPAREERLALFREEYRSLVGRPFSGFDREPVLLGTASREGSTVHELAVTLGALRHGMILKMGRPEWPNDP